MFPVPHCSNSRLTGCKGVAFGSVSAALFKNTADVRPPSSRSHIKTCLFSAVGSGIDAEEQRKSSHCHWSQVREVKKNKNG